MEQDTREWLQLTGTVVVGITALAFGVKIAAPAVGEAIGLGINTVKASTTGPVWLTPVSTIIVNATFVSGSVLIIQKVANEAKKGIFATIAATLGVLQSTIIGALKELWPAEKWQKIAFQAAVALLFTTAALIWKRKGVRPKLFAAILFLLPPVAILARATALANVSGTPSVLDRLGALSATTWLVFAAIVAMTVAVVLARMVLADES